MNDDRIDRVTETPHTTIIEKRGGGGGMLIGLALLIAVLIGGYYLYTKNQSDSRKNDAISAAAKDVGDTAKKTGDAISNAVH